MSPRIRLLKRPWGNLRCHCGHLLIQHRAGGIGLPWCFALHCQCTRYRAPGGEGARRAVREYADVLNRLKDEKRQLVTRKPVTSADHPPVSADDQTRS